MFERIGMKGFIKNNSTGEIKRFQYNPTTLQYSRSATYTELAAPGMAYPNTQFVRGDQRSFPVELFFYDNPCTGYIESYIKFLEGFLPPEVNSSSFKKPPEMTFCCGYFIRKCVIESMETTIELFNRFGKPTQAKVTLQLKQVGV